MNIRRQSGTFQFEEEFFSKIVQSNGKVYHEVLLSMIFLQTKPKVKSVNENYHDLFFTVIKNRDHEEIVNDKYEDNENHYNKFNDIVPNPYIGRKIDKVMLR